MGREVRVRAPIPCFICSDANSSLRRRVTKVVMGHVSSMIGKSWQEKDAAVLLLTAVAVRKESRLGGVSEVNPGVPVIDFFVQHVGNDLGGGEVMLLAGSLKFVSTFRNQFNGAQLNTIFP